MAETYEKLISLAETIRTNVLPESNTAGLVGRMLREIIEKVREVNTSSSGAVTDMTVTPSADSTGVKLQFVLNAGEKNLVHVVSLPIVSNSAAGVITPATLADITSQLNSMSKNIINLANSSALQERTIAELKQQIANEVTARQNADTSLGSQISGVETSLSDEITKVNDAVNNLKNSVGIESGIAPLGGDGLVPEDYLPDMRTKIGREPGMAFPSVAGKELEDAVGTINTKLGIMPIVNVNAIKSANYTLSTAINAVLAAVETYGSLMISGLVMTYRKDSTHWELKQYVGDGGSLPHFQNTDNWQDIGGGGSSAVFNPTVSYPISGFYALYDPDNETASAVDVAWNAGKTQYGMLLTIQQ